MPVSRGPEPAQALSALAVLLVVLAIHGWLARRALADLGRPGQRVRTSTKEIWTFVIVFVGIVGPIAWFTFGSDTGW
ncbi:MAG TPA: PLD nuclease N-terminal domain-containing protein [Candidatus Limnocylindrales bacterium]